MMTPALEKLAKDFCAQKEAALMSQLESLIKDEILVIYQNEHQTKLDQDADGNYIMTLTQRAGLVADVENKITKLKLEILKLREVLAFYANTYSIGMCCCDGGEKARKTLGIE